MKNLIAHLLSMLIIGFAVYVIAVFIFKANKESAVWYGISAATTEIIVKGIYKLYDLLIRRRQG
jgi:hypothetical protein